MSLITVSIIAYQLPIDARIDRIVTPLHCKAGWYYDYLFLFIISWHLIHVLVLFDRWINYKSHLCHRAYVPWNSVQKWCLVWNHFQQILKQSSCEWRITCLFYLLSNTLILFRSKCFRPCQKQNFYISIIHMIMTIPININKTEVSHSRLVINLARLTLKDPWSFFSWVLTCGCVLQCGRTSTSTVWFDQSEAHRIGVRYLFLSILVGLRTTLIIFLSQHCFFSSPV